MCAALGREVAFVLIRNHPEVLDLPAGAVASRMTALAALLQPRLQPQQEQAHVGLLQGTNFSDVIAGSAQQAPCREDLERAWQMIEQRGDILLLPSQQLGANLESLVEGLGYVKWEVQNHVWHALTTFLFY